MNAAARAARSIGILVAMCCCHCCRTVQVKSHCRECSARVNFGTQTGADSALGYGDSLHVVAAGSIGADRRNQATDAEVRRVDGHSGQGRTCL